MACIAHRFHRPKNQTTEFHHVIPRAWQLTVAPRPLIANDDTLFDPRTVELCPTGHRNVHYHIVRLMRAAMVAKTDDPLVAHQIVKRRGREFVIAYLALTRWRGRGYTLKQLYDAGEYGQA